MSTPRHILVVGAVRSSQQQAPVDALRLEGFKASWVPDNENTLAFIGQKGLPHLALVSLALRNREGLELVRELSGRGTPVIATADNSPQTAIESLTWADDFVRQPVNPQELAARIRSILGRIADFGYAENPVLAFDERLSVDYTTNELIIAGSRETLTPTESRLLHTLLWHRGKAVDSRTLMLRTWPAEGVYEYVLRVHIHRLRHKLEADPRNPKYLLTKRGTGYSFAAGNLRTDP